MAHRSAIASSWVLIPGNRGASMPTTTPASRSGRDCAAAPAAGSLFWVSDTGVRYGIEGGTGRNDGPVKTAAALGLDGPALLIGPDRDIPAPDVGTTAQEMAWIMDTYSMQAGHTVPAGTVVTTGTWAGAPAAAPGDAVHLEFAGLGRADAHF